jgi:hypothetical protein
MPIIPHSLSVGGKKLIVINPNEFAAPAHLEREINGGESADQTNDE